MPQPEATAGTVDPLMTRWLKKLVPRSRHRTVHASLSHDLADNHGQLLFEQQLGICAVSGLPFSLTEFADVLVKHPFAPSLDRISSHGGYTADNLRLVCIAVNFGMGQWGEELYLTFARAAVAHSDRLAAVPKAPAGETNANVSPGNELTGWSSLQRERIAAAEVIAATLVGEQLRQQRRRIASLKRNLTLGLDGLKLAGIRAAQASAARRSGKRER